MKTLWIIVLLLTIACSLLAQESDVLPRTNPEDLVPVINPNGGNFSSPQRVSISSKTGAIHYTLDGRRPTTSSPKYTAPIAIDQNTTLSVRVFADDGVSGTLVSAGFVFKTEKPTISPASGSFSRPERITITTPTSGAEIRYTINGREPNNRSHLYTEPITVDRNTTLRVKAFKENWNESEEVSGEYRFTAINPTLSIPGGSFRESQQVTIRTVTEGAQIRYTTDGSEPTERSNLYTSPITIDRNMRLKASAFKEGWGASGTVEADFSFTVQRPSIELPSGGYQSPQSTSLSCPTDNVHIRYTTDGSEPTESSLLYSQPITIDGNTNLRVRAFREGWSPSESVTANYTFTLPAPTITPSGGDFTTAQNVTITSPIAGAEIRYTKDGSPPNESSTLYTGPITIDGRADVRAKAFRKEWTTSGTVAENYRFTLRQPQLNPPPGSFSYPQAVSFTSETPGVKFRYTIDGTAVTESSPLYDRPIDIFGQRDVRARAYKDGWTPSEEVSGRYIITVSRPTFTPEGGKYDLPQRIAITTMTDGAKIYYTDDGSTPSRNSKEFTEAFLITEDKNLRAIAYKDGWVTSQIASEEYEVKASMVHVQRGSFTPMGSDESVRLSRSFYIDRYPVTQEQWAIVMGDNPSRHEMFFGNNNPVEWVSWYQAIKYCNLLSIKEGFRPVYSIAGNTNPNLWGEVPSTPDSTWCAVVFNYNANGYRLPTSAEWEYAARSAGKDYYIYAGSDILEEVAWHDSNSDKSTKPVGRKIPNSLGIHDMTGNVWEWCWDATDRGCNASGTDPVGAEKGANRILRGGSFLSSSNICRIDNTISFKPHQGYPSRGFRVVRNAN